MIHKSILTLCAIGLSVSCWAQEGEFPIYTGYPAMIKKVQDNCPDYKREIAYLSMSQVSAQNRVLDLDEKESFSQIRWANEYEPTSCTIALAENTIEGMSFILANRPTERPAYDEVDKDIARALLTLWLVEPKRDSSKYTKAIEHADLYLGKRHDGYKPEHEEAYYVLSDEIAKVAQWAKNDADRIRLNQLAADYARQGYSKARVKTDNALALSVALVALIQKTPAQSKEQIELLNELDTLAPTPWVRHIQIALLYAQRHDFEKVKMWLEAYGNTNTDYPCMSVSGGYESIIANFSDADQQKWLRQNRINTCQKTKAVLMDKIKKIKDNFERAESMDGIINATISMSFLETKLQIIKRRINEQQTP